MLFFLSALSVKASSSGLSSTNRMTLSCMPCLHVIAWVQREKESRALAGIAFCPDLAAMPVNDALHCGQSNSSTRKFIGAVQALKGAKEPRSVFGIEACSVIFHEICW